MKFILLFEDDPDAAPNIRKTRMAAHLSFLEANSGKIGAAGPLSKPSGEAAGGLWLVEAKNENEVERLVQEDPFWPTGLRKGVVAEIEERFCFSLYPRLTQPLQRLA